jgi:hypothetical protein
MLGTGVLAEGAQQVPNGTFRRTQIEGGLAMDDPERRGRSRDVLDRW